MGSHKFFITDPILMTLLSLSISQDLDFRIKLGVEVGSLLPTIERLPKGMQSPERPGWPQFPSMSEILNGLWMRKASLMLACWKTLAIWMPDQLGFMNYSKLMRKLNMLLMNVHSRSLNMFIGTMTTILSVKGVLFGQSISLK
ncbi:hypothetical protein SDC9_103093 [bioreactor metagenome]|uniref:Uncharacterized protein n=1 Tax=bioreactor metagenome TaxID=1076179 RepID=A0A645AVF6_9ZZZZ